MHISTTSAVEKSLRSGEYPICGGLDLQFAFHELFARILGPVLRGRQCHLVAADLREQPLQRTRGRLHGLTRLQPREDLDPAAPAVVHVDPLPFRQHRFLHQDGDANLRRLRRIDTGKALFRDADNRHRIVVHEDLLADDLRVARKAAGPVVIGQHHDWMPLIDLVVLSGIEDAARRGANTEHREVIARDQLRLQPLGAIVDADRGRHDAPAQHFRQRRRPLLIVLVDGIRMHPHAHVAAVVLATLVQHDQLFGMLDWQLAEQDLVDQREDGRVGPDAERQREDRNRREERTAPQSAERETDIRQ